METRSEQHLAYWFPTKPHKNLVAEKNEMKYSEVYCGMDFEPL